MSRLPQHRRLFINARGHDTKVVDFWKQMLVNQMKSSLLWTGALFLTALNEAAISLLTFSFELLSQSIVMLVQVKSQEVSGGEILATRRTSIGVLLGVVDLKRIDG
jgi:hypothetical protein